MSSPTKKFQDVGIMILKYLTKKIGSYGLRECFEVMRENLVSFTVDYIAFFRIDPKNYNETQKYQNLTNS